MFTSLNGVIKATVCYLFFVYICSCVSGRVLIRMHVYFCFSLSCVLYSKYRQSRVLHVSLNYATVVRFQGFFGDCFSFVRYCITRRV
jgi:hypothetical protein